MKVAGALQNLEMRFAGFIAKEANRHGRVTDAQVAKRHLRKPIGQNRVQREQVERSDGLKAQYGLQHERKRRFVPGLRRIRARIRSGMAAFRPIVTADAFRDPEILPAQSKLVEGAREPERFFIEAESP